MSALDFGRLRTLLFLPASNDRAIAKAKSLAVDLVILDLEDAVKAEEKERAREGALRALSDEWPMPVAVRVNGVGTKPHEADIAGFVSSSADALVVPMVERADDVRGLRQQTGRPVVAMIETAVGVLAAPEIARAASALLVGTNDLAADLGLPPSSGREAMLFALQSIVVAARAARIAVFDGVYNRVDDADGFATEAAQGRALGFDGKSLIHPSQVEAGRLAFSPSREEIERAERLVAAASGGAERFEGAMIENLHVAAARRLLLRR